jgi:hypothetical protein
MCRGKTRVTGFQLLSIAEKREIGRGSKNLDEMHSRRREDNLFEKDSKMYTAVVCEGVAF